MPFSKAKGLVQTVLFHPVRPYLVVATQRHVRIYNLSKLELTKKLQTGAKWICFIAVHSHGDNLLLGNMLFNVYFVWHTAAVYRKSPTFF